MYTEIIKIDDSNIDYAIEKSSQIIKNGGLVIFPTETVYGIGANALSISSCKKIYDAKGRPSDNPLIVHISKKEDLYNIATDIDLRAEKIIDEFWPGPLTIIVRKKEIVPYQTTGNLDTVAVRMPSNKIANNLITKSATPIAAPSANISGRPSITCEEYLKSEFDGKVDIILLDNQTTIGIESTVIDTTKKNIKILRPGFITKSDIEKVLNEDVLLDENINDESIVPISPGMKYKHYSPLCELYVVVGDDLEKIEKVLKAQKKDFDDNIYSFVLAKSEFCKYFNNFISIGQNDVEVARDIFYILRKLDEKNIKKAYIFNMNKSELDFSIMDRIKKAAEHKII